MNLLNVLVAYLLLLKSFSIIIQKLKKKNLCPAAWRNTSDPHGVFL